MANPKVAAPPAPVPAYVPNPAKIASTKRKAALKSLAGIRVK